jgi:hypothetical protein
VRVPLACLLVAIYFVFWSPSFGQSVPPGAPVPRSAADSPRIVAPTGSGVQPATTRSDPMELRREAKQILELSRSVQLDIDSVNRGLLPKDTIDKLKRIEKLSKHLRSQVGR